MIVSLIVARDRNGVIGADGELPWRLPDDLKHFKRTTLGKPVVMGRRTFDSIGRPLPQRINIVVTRQEGLVIEGCVVVTSPQAAVEAAGEVKELVVIGGAEIYRLFLNRADRLYVTEVNAEVDGDVRFPAIDEAEWTEIACEEHGPDDRHVHAFVMRTLDRR